MKPNEFFQYQSKKSPLANSPFKSAKARQQKEPPEKFPNMFTPLEKKTHKVKGKDIFGADGGLVPSTAHPGREDSLTGCASPSNSIAVYTLLCILRKMKVQCGLEAMLDYIEEYLETIEHYNPELKTAVIEALSRMSVEKIYEEAVDGDPDITL